MTIKDRTRVSAVTLGAELPHGTLSPRDNSAFRILVVGDLGAAASFHTPASVDRDDLDQVIERLQVRIRLQLNEGDPDLEIRLRQFDDFHPDQLFSGLRLFESLRSRRQRLQDESTCRDEIAAMVRENAGDAQTPGSPDASSGPAVTSGSRPDELLSEVLRVTEASQKPLEQQVLEGVVDWDAYVRQLVAPYVVSKADPRQADLIAGVDSAITETMRRILHHRVFQRIEAVWQGIRFLTRRLETDRTLQLSVLHVEKGDLAADVLDGDDLTRTKLYKLLTDSISVEGTDPWSLIVGDFQFANSPDDCETLARIAQICEAAGAVFVSGAAPGIAGSPDFIQDSTSEDLTDPRHWLSPGAEELHRWESLRELAASRHVVLTLPKLMARRPYGPDSDPIESLQFVELPDGFEQKRYLWMNGAFGIAALLGEAFARCGWELASHLPSELERLPHHIFQEAGEEQLQPGTETALSERAAQKFAEFGLTVFRAVRNEETIRVDSIPTLFAADPGLPL